MDVPPDEPEDELVEDVDELELLEELELDELLLEEELELLDVPESQTAPVTSGTSAAPFPFVPWKPNSTYCPGWMFAFHPRLVAL